MPNLRCKNCDADFTVRGSVTEVYETYDPGHYDSTGLFHSDDDEEVGESVRAFCTACFTSIWEDSDD